eukprot:579078-Ditylum_brightwellii.AAC.1
MSYDDLKTAEDTLKQQVVAFLGLDPNPLRNPWAHGVCRQGGGVQWRHPPGHLLGGGEEGVGGGMVAFGFAPISDVEVEAGGCGVIPFRSRKFVSNTLFPTVSFGKPSSS